MAETFHLVEEALRSSCRIAAVIAEDSASERAMELVAGRAEVITISDTLFESIRATESSQGVMALVEPAVSDLAEVQSAGGVAVVLDGIQDPGNAGTISTILFTPLPPIWIMRPRPGLCCGHGRDNQHLTSSAAVGEGSSPG